MKNGLKKQAIDLRKQGLSYNEIGKEVPVSKSTLSLWLKSVPLPPEHRARLYTKQIQILSRGTPSQKERRLQEVESILIHAGLEIKMPLDFETIRFMGVALYWAEGTKKNMFQLTNSDPSLIAFMVRWLEIMFAVKPHELRARLNIYPKQNDMEIKKFWSNLLGIPMTNFGKSFVKPIGTGYRKNNLYYGTIRIEVLKSVDTRYRVFGWLQAILREMNLPNPPLWKKETVAAKVPVNLNYSENTV